MTAVSVIIPVYNVEKYISQCLDSLLEQTLTNIEIICVDDGSTDGTLQLLEEYRQKDARVSVYHQQNKFAGVARNTGMQYATGKYVIFLDSDDFFDKTLLEKTYNEAEKSQAEVVLFGAKIYDDPTGEVTPAPWLFRKKYLPANVPFSAEDANGNLLYATAPNPWTKLFLREYIQKLDIEFMPLQNSNDVYFIYVATCCANRISYVAEDLVFYRKGITTNLQSTKSKNPLCFLEAYHAAFCELNERGVYNQVCKGFRDAVIGGCLYNYDSVDEDTKRIIAESFLSDKFTNMDLLSGEKAEYSDSKKYDRLKSLLSTLRWKHKFDSLQYKEDAVCIKKAELNDSPKVSVVIPCYNVEKYVEECVNSIQTQTLKEIEIICVDDGATDGTLEILKKLGDSDSRITLLTQSNGGLSFARNQGAKVACGKYLYFMDSDDYLEQDALEILYNTAEERQLDVVYFDAESFFESSSLSKDEAVYEGYYVRKHDYSHCETGIDLLYHLSKNKEYRQQACLQFHRRDFFISENLWFIPGIIHEDNPFTFKGMLAAKRVAHIPRQFFHRRVRANSIMTAGKSFAHAYGYFVSYLNMVETANHYAFTLEQETAIAQVFRNVIYNVRKTYRLLPYSERQSYKVLPPIERSLFETLAIQPPAKIVTTAASIPDKKSYRIGRIITFIPRSIKAVICTYKKHGFVYTVKRSMRKIKKILKKLFK